jgi:hypothetical protein
MVVNTLKGFDEIGQSLLNDQLESNLSTYFDYNLLEKGGFFNVVIPTSGAYGGNAHKLRRVDDPNYDAGQIWEGFRSNWVYESGLSYGTQPIRISGVYVNDTFYPAGTTGSFAYHINYPLGRVVFDSAISTTATVHVEHSYKWFSFSTADVDWYRNLQFNSFRVDDSHFLAVTSGNWAVLSQSRMQMPAVVVEAGGRRHFAGHQLGGGQKVYQEVFFHIFTEDHWMRKQSIDAITYQNEKKINLFNKNLLVYPLDHNGSLVSGANTYPNWLAETGAGGYYWKSAILDDMALVDSYTKPPLYAATVKATVEVVLGEI